jgi:putative endonuclease
MKLYFVYIMTNQPYGTLYIGVAPDLEKRVWQHKQGLADGFTRNYALKQRVYFEETTEAVIAIQREKKPKRWNSDWKIDFFNARNAEWKDFSEDWCAMDPRVKPEDDKVAVGIK